MNPLLRMCETLNLDCEPVGSRRSVRPMPTDTDDDWLVFVTLDQIEALKVVAETLPETDRKPSMGDEDTPHFTSLRLGEVNLICTMKGDFFKRFLLAQKTCEWLNLREKADRIVVFRAILYAEAPEAP